MSLRVREYILCAAVIGPLMVRILWRALDGFPSGKISESAMIPRGTVARGRLKKIKSKFPTRQLLHCQWPFWLSRELPTNFHWEGVFPGLECLQPCQKIHTSQDLSFYDILIPAVIPPKKKTDSVALHSLDQTPCLCLGLFFLFPVECYFGLPQLISNRVISHIIKSWALKTRELLLWVKANTYEVQVTQRVCNLNPSMPRWNVACW